MHAHATVIKVEESEFFHGEFTARIAMARLYANAPQAYGTVPVTGPEAVWPGQSLMVVGEYVGTGFVGDRIFVR
jgi:hypothetical protein